MTYNKKYIYMTKPNQEIVLTHLSN